MSDHEEQQERAAADNPHATPAAALARLLVIPFSLSIWFTAWNILQMCGLDYSEAGWYGLAAGWWSMFLYMAGYDYLMSRSNKEGDEKSD